MTQARAKTATKKPATGFKSPATAGKVAKSAAASKAAPAAKAVADKKKAAPVAAKSAAKSRRASAAPLRLDIGCGKNKKEGFTGVDQYAMKGVDVVMDVRQRWPWDDGTVDEAYCSHFLEHLTGLERVAFMNELYRVLKPGAKATIITPHWGSNRAYGDFTHQWPPVSEMYFAYLSATWRESQAPHTDKRWNPQGYDCDFQATYGYGLHPSLHQMDEGRRQEGMMWHKDAITDMVATLTKIG